MEKMQELKYALQATHRDARRAVFPMAFRHRLCRALQMSGAFSCAWKCSCKALAVACLRIESFYCLPSCVHFRHEQGSRSGRAAAAAPHMSNFLAWALTNSSLTVFFLVGPSVAYIL